MQATVQPSASLPQTQPACLTDPTTELVDCGNWAVSASWAVPSHGRVGRLHGPPGARRQHRRQPDPVRRAQRLKPLGADLPDLGHDLAGVQRLGRHTASTPARRGGPTKVSYNRPFATRAGHAQRRTTSCPAEYPMIRFLEANGYDVSYQAGHRHRSPGSLLLNHKTFLSVGHDEYWSGQQRANVEAARDAGREPGLLLGQRGLLEDPMGAVDRRDRTPPTGRSSATRRRPTTPRPIRPRPGRAPGAIRGSVRRPTGGAPRTR